MASDFSASATAELCRTVYKVLISPDVKKEAVLWPVR